MKILNTIRGVFKQAGVKKAPKDVCTDIDNGTWEAIDVEDLTPVKRFYGKDITL